MLAGSLIKRSNIVLQM